MSIAFPRGRKFLFGPNTPNELQLPPLRSQVKNFARDAVRVVKGVATGKGATVSREVAEARFAICKDCELFKESSERCSHPACACFLRIKTWSKALSCPAGKWGNE